MATRRRSAPKYRDGGGVPVARDGAPTAREMEPAGADELPLVSSPDDALRQAIEGQRRAEDMQRQAAEQQPQTLDDHIEAMPISDFKKAALREHPELLDVSTRQIANEAYQEALAAGIADDTPDMTAFMVSAVRTEMQERRRRLAEAAKAAASSMRQASSPEIMFKLSPEQAAARLDQEASAMMQANNVERSSALAVADHVGMAVPPPPARRSMPITAPVTREVPTSGKRYPAELTLTAAEREIARNSWTDHRLSNFEKERMYLQNKLRLAAERAAGRYPMPERN